MPDRPEEAVIASIRDGLLALLLQGPAYGLLLRNELASRTGREAPLNVGQVYTTLERLMSAGLVSQDRDTADGLPRYVLTAEGSAVASEWLSAPAIDSASPWESMRFQVLLARSLPGVSSDELVRRFREYWEQRRTSAGASLAEAARDLLAAAAIDWLDRVSASCDAGEPVQMTRPPRGRPVGHGLR